MASFCKSIVNGLALTKISPNTLTFIGLIINIGAAVLLRLRQRADNRMFFYAGLVIIGAGIFDMVDGRVARQTDQVSVFGAFFDSVIDRYSDVALFFGLLVYYARGTPPVLRLAGGVCDVHFADGELHARPRRGAHRQLQGRLHGAAGAHRAHHSRRAVQSLGRDGSGALGAGRCFHHDGDPPHHLHLPADSSPRAAQGQGSRRADARIAAKHRRRLSGNEACLERVGRVASLSPG